MKKSLILKSISGVVIASTLSALAPLGVSAQWKKNSDNTWCYTQNESKVTGWKCISGTWYYFNGNGTMCTGWMYSNGVWYYLGYGGQMKTGWANVNGTWYYLDESGKMATGWIKHNGKTYFADSNGAMQTGVLKINGSIYYFSNSGAMQTGSVLIAGKSYNFGIDGKLTDDVKITYSKEFANNGNVIVNDSESDDKKDDISNNNVNNSSGAIEKPSNDNTADNNESGNNTNSSNSSTDKNETNNSGNNNSANDKNESSNDKTEADKEVSSDKEESSSQTGKLPELPSKYSVKDMQSAEEKILQLMNEKRAEAGLSPLKMDNTLREVARYKSNHMIQYDYFSHNNPDGTTWKNWLSTLNYKYTATAENIAYNSSNAEELFNQWWNSAGHRQNMMNASYTKVGIGVVYGNNKYMGTQTFSN